MICRISGDLFQSEVFILIRPIEDYIAFADAKLRRDLGKREQAIQWFGKSLLGTIYERLASFGPTARQYSS